MCPETQEITYTERVQNSLEDILQSSLGADNFRLDWYKGKLSTKPERVNPDVDRFKLSLMCGTLSRDLKGKLVQQGINAEVCCGDNVDPLDHFYISAKEGSDEVLVDPTIGQFIEGFNHVFVGSREKLRDLVLNQTGEGKKYKIVEIFDKYSPEEVFELVWGNQSIPMALRAKPPRKFLNFGFINRTE